MTLSIFHLRSFGRSGIVRAWVPNGVAPKAEPASRSVRVWQVAHDPSGTLSLRARFSRYEVSYGVNHQTWERGTLFCDTRSGKLYYYDHQVVRLRRVVRDCAVCGPKHVRFVNGVKSCWECGEVLK